jgi:D-alanyl-D-alanine carboxypeptidase
MALMAEQPAFAIDNLEAMTAMATLRGLRRHEEALTLVWVDVSLDGRDQFLIAEAAQAWRSMRDAAANDHVALHVESSFRSIERQRLIVQRRLDAGHTLADIFRSVAPPGFSEHHSGRAVDIVSPDHPALDERFEHTAAFAWLTQHAATHGFTLTYPHGNSDGYVYEPWHWCFHSGLHVEQRLARL